MNAQDIFNFIVIAVPYVLGAFGASGIAAAWLPRAAPGTVWGTIRGVLDLLAQNYGNAKNHVPA